MHTHIAHRELFHDHFLSGMKEIFQQRALAEHGARVEASLVERIVARRLRDPDCSQLLSAMDAAGIAVSVLLIADFGFGYDEGSLTLDTLYRHYHRVRNANPERFMVFGGTDPRRGPAALELFEHGLRDLGFRGLKLYPPCGYEINSPGLFPYYEACARYRVPVLVHTGPSLETMFGDRQYPASLLDAAKQFPSVNFVLGHAAFQNHDVNLAVAVECRNVYLETSGFQRHLDRRDEHAQRFKELFQRIPEQVVFGTDWPVFNINGTQQDWVRYFDELGVLNETDRARFFWKNAQVALNYDPLTSMRN